MPLSTVATVCAGLLTGLVCGLAAVVMLAEGLIYAGVPSPLPDVVPGVTWTEPAAHHGWYAPS